MVFAWILAHKFLTLLALISAAFCVSTIVLGVSNAQLKSEIEELKENTSPSTSSSTNPSITSSSGSTSTSTSASIPTTTTPPATDAMSKYRLPSAIKPSLYHLYLYPRLDTGLFSGRVVVTMSVDQTAPSVVVHSNKLDVSSVTVAGRAANFEVDEFYEIVTITKGDGTSFTSSDTSLEIDFSGDMKNRIVGLYTSSYTNSDGGSTTMATSKFEPTYARQAFPCFDEPNMKAKYVVHLLKPKADNYIALSNYPVDTTVSYDTDNDLVTFKETVSMSTYLTCFIVSDFKFTETTFNNNGTPVALRVYASPGNLNKTTYAGEVAKKVIEFYVDYFGISYPLPKLDMVAIPDFVSGAMEHWGLVTYRETALLYTNATHSSANKQRVATVIAHELAHSWFGNLVTMDWWNDLWLNEGFASYIEFKGTAAAEPDWEMMSQFQTSDLHSVLSLDATLSSHPIVVSVTTPDEITAIFDTISYNKGASILRMLEDTVGEENFRKGVTNYLNKYAYGNAVTKNFLEEIQAVVGSGFNVAQMMDTFTAQMGYPVVDVTYDATSGAYVLTQKRFLKDPNATYDMSNVTYQYKWTIPITYVTDIGKSGGLILFPYSQESITVPKPTGASWLKFNYDQIGYYRVNYDPATWQGLIEIYNQLGLMDRTHLLEETFSIAEAGQLSYDVPLDLTKKLTQELGYAPWSVASSKLQDVLKYLKGSSQEASFKNYVKGIVSNAYNNFTWDESYEDGHVTRLTRVVVLTLACAVEHEECVAQAERKFNDWIANPSQGLSQDLRGIVYKYGMLNADETTWGRLLDVYVAETDATEKLKLVNGLASVKNTTLLEKLLELAKNESVVRGQDYFTVVRYISANSYGTDLVWDWVRENWAYLVDRFTLNDRYLGSLIPGITGSFSTQERLAEMEAFFGKYPDAGAGASNRKTAIETVENNIRWLANYKETVESWVRNATVG
ncbi:glutamyl aminopeptidase isoform X3 [Cylas formicarius]|uniref:glutamyl aminopeptidase isoform X3 n=1 Tax=Cylas formicarius TaxID=197179 RepID=UPI0029589937|nr:glutamyl aminopeptidase isoform X3 [Cylas formicarius]